MRRIMNGRKSNWGVILGLAVGMATLAASGSNLNADEKTERKKIDAGGLSFEVPKTWKNEQPSSRMRRAQLKVEPVKGDKEPAELVVFAFPGGAGTVQANIKRWEEQFKDKDGAAPKAETKTVKVKDLEVTRVEVSGRYVAAVQPGSPEKLDKPNFRLLGAIVQTDQAGYYLKMIGPDKTMKAAEADFDKLIESIKSE